MYEFRIRKFGTFRLGPIAQSNHEIETRVQNIACCFRDSACQIDSNLFHHLDCKGMWLAAIDAGITYLKMPGVHSIEQSCRHRALHTVSRAQKQNSELHVRNSDQRQSLLA